MNKILNWSIGMKKNTVKKVTFTLNKLAEIAFGDVQIPKHFQDIADKEITDMSQRAFSSQPEHMQGIRVLFITVFDDKRMKEYVNFAVQNVVIVSAFDIIDDNSSTLPIIKLESISAVRTAWYNVGKYFKQNIRIPTIGITGSIGKTTATRFMENIFSMRGKVFVSGGNLNNADFIVRQMARGYDSSYDYHVQEVGGGVIGAVQCSAKILDVDAFCISNVLPHHLDHYKTIENVLVDKTSFDRVGKKAIFGVINIDDDLLRNHKFNNRIITCGIEHTEAQYVAKNIVNSNNFLEFDVVSNNQTAHLKINIPGRHNVYNALLAYAMAKEFGLTDEEIQEGLLKYESDNIRQSIQQVAGRTMYIDCFNCCADSIRSCAETLQTIKIPSWGKRIAVYSGMAALDERYYSHNFAVGAELKNYDIDEFLFVGIAKDASIAELNTYGNTYALYEGAKSVITDRPLSYFDNLKDAAEYLRLISRPGDAILFKGSFRMCLLGIIDLAFGTAYTHYCTYYGAQRIVEDGYIAYYYKEFDGCNIMQNRNKDSSIIIPDKIAGKPVFRIGKQIFKDRNIHNIQFGNTVSTIGEDCFNGCKYLKKLKIPANVIHIEANAFRNCTSLEYVELEHAGHMGREVFSGCTNLKKVVFTRRCVMLEPDIFAGCSKVVVYAPNGSYAHQYALENHLPVVVN